MGGDAVAITRSDHDLQQGAGIRSVAKRGRRRTAGLSLIRISRKVLIHCFSAGKRGRSIVVQDET